jgi:hypothetical protein
MHACKFSLNFLNYFLMEKDDMAFGDVAFLHVEKIHS